VTRLAFTGAIAGLGSSSGTRVVVGRWDDSPFGAFADVMVAEPDGTRVLLAPDEQVAAFVADTYRFDRVDVGPVEVTRGWLVAAPGLDLRITVGGRPPLGRVLRVVPGRLATAPGWSRVTDPVARALLRGVRTRGTAGHGRRETYGATDLHRITGISGSWQGHDLGELAAVDPEPGFGFGSTPRTPAVTSLVTTVDVPVGTAVEGSGA
jgi:hypothetical protein